MNLKVDTKAFQRALRQVYLVSKKTLAQQLNQRVFNVAVRAFDGTPPASNPTPGINYRPNRFKIANELYKEIAVTIKLAKTGKHKGQYRTRRKNRYRQFTLANLIVQKRRGRSGLPGLWGKAMRDATTKMVGARQRGVGFLKSVFIPIIRGLVPYVSYRKMPKDNMRNISRWPGSAGSGTFHPAQTGWKPTAYLKTLTKVRSHEEGKISNFQTQVMQHALNEEAKEMRKHALDSLKKNLKPYGGK